MFNSFLKKFKKDEKGDQTKDPVCGMRVANEISLIYQNQAYNFCSDHCKEQFEQNPENYIIK